MARTKYTFAQALPSGDSPMAKFVAKKIEQACNFYMNGDLQNATYLFTKLLNRMIDDPTLLYYAACCELQQGKHGIAINLFRRAVEINPKSHESWHNLAFALKMEQYNSLAEDAAIEAVQLDPENPDYWNTLGCCYVNEGVPEKCVEALSKALSIDASHADANHNIGLAYLELGQWKKGWDGYKWRFLSDNGLQENHWYKSSVPRWDGQKGKRVVVYGEQGLGDEMMFGTCLPDIIRDSEAVALDLNPKTDKLFMRSFPEVFINPEREEAKGNKGTIDWADDFKPDYKIPVADLARFYRPDDGSFPSWEKPLLHADPERVEHYKKQLDGRFNVAFAWTGGGSKTRIDLRTVNPKLWEPLFKTPNTRFISFQYHDWAAEEAKLVGFEHWDEPSKNLDEQAAMMSACDLVISVCQTGIHLAGALGVPCWILTPSKPAWRYGLRHDKMAWYDSIRMFRQGKTENWEPVIQRVRKELVKVAKLKEAA